MKFEGVPQVATTEEQPEKKPQRRRRTTTKKPKTSAEERYAALEKASKKWNKKNPWNKKRQATEVSGQEAELLEATRRLRKGDFTAEQDIEDIEQNIRILKEGAMTLEEAEAKVAAHKRAGVQAKNNINKRKPHSRRTISSSSGPMPGVKSAIRREKIAAQTKNRREEAKEDLVYNAAVAEEDAFRKKAATLRDRKVAEKVAENLRKSAALRKNSDPKKWSDLTEAVVVEERAKELQAREPKSPEEIQEINTRNRLVPERLVQSVEEGFEMRRRHARERARRRGKEMRHADVIRERWMQTPEPAEQPEEAVEVGAEPKESEPVVEVQSVEPVKPPETDVDVKTPEVTDAESEILEGRLPTPEEEARFLKEDKEAIRNSLKEIRGSLERTSEILSGGVKKESEEEILEPVVVDEGPKGVLARFKRRVMGWFTRDNRAT